MLSSEIASTLGGRFVIMNIYPYSFSEYLTANGVATANFEVQTADTTAVSPKTGDNGQAALWITLLILSCGVLTAVGIRKKVR